MFLFADFRAFLLIHLLFFCMASPLHAKDYTIPEIRVEVHIQEDGNIRITEHRTYVYDGDFSWANYRLPKKGFSALRDIKVSENGDAFINLNTEENGTFLVEESDDAYNIKWFYDAEDEQKVFSISYTLESAVVVGESWSEFFWTYAAAGREKSTDYIEITVQLPVSVLKDNLHFWVREPDWGLQAATFEKGFEFSGTELSRHQAVTIRTVFPTSVFNASVAVNDPGFTLEMAEQQEADFKQQQQLRAEEEAKNQALAKEALVVLSGLSIVIFIFLYRKYGSRHKVNLSTNESILIPGREKPAAIAWLLQNRTVRYSSIMTTLFDLARRDYFTLEENEPDKKGIFASKEPYFTIHPTEKAPDKTLTPFELSLHNFVNERIDEEGNKLSEVFKFGASSVTKWFNSWKKEIKAYCDTKEWIDKTSYKGMYWNSAAQTLLMIAGIVGIFLLHPLMFISVAISFVALVLSLVIIRRTPKGEEVYRRWHNYLKALKKAKEHSIPENHLGLHFIYAIALHAGKKPVEQMFEQNPNAMAAVYWIVILPGSQSSPADIAGTFSNLAASASTTAGGGSFGGGASAGMAGGGASGGAG